MLKKLLIFAMSLSTHVFPQALLSSDPDSAEVGEYLELSLTGENADFYVSSNIWGAPVIRHGGVTVFNRGYTIHDSDHMDVVFDLPETIDTGTAQLYMQNRDDLDTLPFRIVLPGNGYTFLGPSMNSSYYYLSVEFPVRIRNAQVNQPDPEQWEIYLEAEGKSIEPVDIAFNGPDELNALFNFHPDTVNYYDLKVRVDGQEILSRDSSFRLYPPGSNLEYIHDFPNWKGRPGELLNVALTLSGFGEPSSFIRHYWNANLFLGEDTVPSRSVAYEDGSSFYANFELPGDMAEGLWHLQLISNRGMTLLAADTLFRFDVLDVNSENTPPGFSGIAPDSFYLGTTSSMMVKLNHLNLTTPPSPAEFWIERGERILRPESIEADGTDGFKAVFQFTLTDSTGLYHAHLISGSDTLHFYSGVNIKPPQSQMTVTAVTEAFPGGSVRLTVEGSRTLFSNRGFDYYNPDPYPLAYLKSPEDSVQNLSVRDAEVQVIHDSLILVDFLIPEHWPAGKYDLQVRQNPPFPSMMKYGAVDIKLPTDQDMYIHSLNPDSAIQTEKWIINLRTVNFQLNSLGEVPNVILSREEYFLEGQDVEIYDDSTLGFKIAVPIDAPGGMYSVALLKGADTFLVRHSGFEVQYLKEIALVEPEFILTGTDQFHVTVKTRNMRLTDYNTVTLYIRSQSGEAAEVSNLEILGPDSLEADVELSGVFPLNTLDVSVSIPNVYTVSREAAITKVDSLTNPIEPSEVLNRNFIAVAGKEVRIAWNLIQELDLVFSLFRPDGMLLETRALGRFKRGSHLIRFPLKTKSQTGLTLWQLRAGAKILGSGKLILVR